MAVLRHAEELGNLALTRAGSSKSAADPDQLHDLAHRAYRPAFRSTDSHPLALEGPRRPAGSISAAIVSAPSGCHSRVNTCGCGSPGRSAACGAGVVAHMRGSGITEAAGPPGYGASDRQEEGRDGGHPLDPRHHLPPHGRPRGDRTRARRADGCRDQVPNDSSTGLRRRCARVRPPPRPGVDTAGGVPDTASGENGSRELAVVMWEGRHGRKASDRLRARVCRFHTRDQRGGRRPVLRLQRRLDPRSCGRPR
jgi:hypothetical protein